MNFRISNRSNPSNVSAVHCLILVISPLATVFIQAAPPIDYYDSVDTSNAAILRATLHEVIDNHTRISFGDSSSTFEILENADADPNDPTRILDIYGNNSYLEVDGGSGDYNREHIWPRSYGFPDNSDSGRFPISDLHNLYLSDNGYNFSRGNEYYDNCNVGCDELVTVPNNGTGGGSGVFPGFSNWSDSDSWQVWTGRQGEAARALFYMDVRYEPLTAAEVMAGVQEPDLILVDDIAMITPTGVNAPIGRMGRLSVILVWNQNDAVDDLERNHNDFIFAAQDNRNPFIDFPEFVDCIFNGDCSAVAPIHPNGLQASIGLNQVNLTWNARVESDLSGYRVYRSTTEGGPYTSLTPSPIAPTSFSDMSAVDGQIYYYVVTAVDADSNESLNSAEVLVNLGQSATVIARESFEDEIGFTINGTRDSLGSGTDYFDIYTDLTAPVGLQVSTTGIDGARFVAAEDTDATGLSDIYTITLDPVTITNFSDLEVTIGLNAADSGNYDVIGQSNQDFVKIFANVDGAGDVLIGQFTKVGTGSNGALGEDTDLDGIGDVEISDYSRLQDYTFSGIPEGDNIVVSIMVLMDSGNEEIVLDNIRINGIDQSFTGIDSWYLF